jgi:hypothetical protein
MKLEDVIKTPISQLKPQTKLIVGNIFNRQGSSNTPLDLNKFSVLKKRILDKGLADRKIEVKLQQGIKQSQRGNSTLVVIDPPYFAPGKTACYPEHDPNDPTIVLKSWDIANRLTDCWVLHCARSL